MKTLNIRVPAAILAIVFWAVAATAAPEQNPASGPITLEQVISHENPLFNCSEAQLAVGQDGLVYLANSGRPAGYVIRLSPTGEGKFGGEIHYAMNGAAADSNGIVAVASAHFAHTVQIFDKHLQHYANASDFLIGDAYGFDAPGHVEPGANDTFLASDQHRDRIERIDESGKTLATYAVPAVNKHHVNDFRVCEAAQFFYVWPYAEPIREVGFDGQEKLQVNFGSVGGWDADANGNAFVIGSRETALKTFGPDGKPTGTLQLQMGALGPTADHPITGMRISGKQVFIKRRHPSEMFQVYDLDTGKFVRSVSIDHDGLKVTYASEVWTAGQSISLGIEFSPSAPRAVSPDWRVWIRPFGTTRYRELKVRGGSITVPADATGLYHVKVTPESDPVERGELPDYILQSVVDIRAPGALVSATIVTADNRMAYAAGETIPFGITLRGSAPAMPPTLTLRLVRDGHTIGTTVVGAGPVAGIETGLPAAFTRQLRPGVYELTVSGENVSGVGQTLSIGDPQQPHPFHTVQYGDYGVLFPGYDDNSPGDVDKSPDASERYIERERKLGFNMTVDRLGIPLYAQAFKWDNRIAYLQNDVAAKLLADPMGTAPERATMPVPLHQSLAQLAGNGIDEMSILMGNDAGLPIGGPGFDGRKMDAVLADLDRVTKDLVAFPAMRGWVWSSNWWVFAGRGAAAATNDADKAAYTAALKNAKDTGAWDAILDKVNAVPYGYAASTQEIFNDELHKITNAPLVTASAAPYRNVHAWPPSALSNVDEVDLHIQWEQMGPPYYAPHNVDYYTRPGKPAWAHPEVWNDDGTGGQILPEEFEMVMRGASGVGESGDLPSWGNQPDDSREAHAGILSEYRAMNGVLKDYGPWLTTLHNADHVAIVASSRMFQTDDWPTVWGTHFGRVLEGYVACLRTHFPASIVFSDDMTPETLKNYKAVLVIDQRFEMEPKLAAAIETARAAGTAIFYDGTCRDTLMTGFKPLGISFDHFDKDPSAAGDDNAFWRFPEYVEPALPAVREALSSVTEPVADVDNSNVMLSERTALGGRYIFAVNDTRPNFDPAKMWKVALRVTSLQPISQPIKLLHATPNVYDILGLRRLPAGETANTVADMQELPMRIYAILPAPIGTVNLGGPSSLKAGDSFAWTVSVTNTVGGDIAASIPVKVRLLDASGNVLDELATATAAKPAEGSFTLPVNVPPGPVTLEATELFSGKTARMQIPTSPAVLPVALSGAVATTANQATRVTTGITPWAYPAPATRFGPHFRDLALTTGGRSAIVNALSWGDNLYSIDTATGKINWHNRIGDFYAFGPMTAGNGAAVQGFDFNSAEGYHLYMIGADGVATRRFALYGMARRSVHRFVPGILNDHMNQFATPARGSWVAAAGDLGLAVWSSDGNPLWQQDWWKGNRDFARYNDTQRWSNVTLYTPLIAAQGDNTLLVADGPVLASYEARSGNLRWKLTLGANGAAHKLLVSPDGSTIALITTTEGGRIFIVRDGKLVQAIQTAADDAAISPDNTRIAVVNGQSLKSYAIGSGLVWQLAADDTLHFPRYSPSGTRLAAASEIGTLYVFDGAGNTLLNRDMAAQCVPAWLPGGDLLVATWMGRLTRLGNDFQPVWSTLVKPAAAPQSNDQLIDHLPAKEPDTVRIGSWSNAVPDNTFPDANVLTSGKTTTTQLHANISLYNGAEKRGIETTQPMSMLIDGEPMPPAKPYVPWHEISWFGEGSAFNYILVDTGATPARYTGITFIEDPNHPESWMRDAYIEYWDAATGAWKFIMPLLSNAATHTHAFPAPVDTTKLRIVLQPGLVGNLRLEQIVFHGGPVTK